MKPVRLDDEAEQELAAAFAWYEARVGGLGDELLAVIDEQIAVIERVPKTFPLVRGGARRLGVRRALLRRFPFAVIFLELLEETRVLAISHHSRRPGYWLKRARRRSTH